MFRDFKAIVVEEAAGTTLPHLHGPALEMMSGRLGRGAGAPERARRGACAAGRPPRRERLVGCPAHS